MADVRAEVLVAGNGLFGSAVTRHLAERGVEVVCIGAPAVGADGRHEPDAEWPSHRVYSSHNDAARLTRRHDRNPRWHATTTAAIGAYRDIEKRSGIGFHEPVGCLMASRAGGDGVEADPFDTMTAGGVEHDLWQAGDRSWKQRWQHVDFPASHRVGFEPAPAGLLRPLRLIEAQNVLARAAGARIEIGTVVGVEREGAQHRVVTADGWAAVADRLVIAAGAFTNFNGLGVAVDVTLKSEVIVLGEVGESTAAELAGFPTVKYLVESPDLQSIYMTPPIRFDDGRHYIKMGSDTRFDHWMTELAQVQRWFNTATDAEYLPLFEPALRALWPELPFVSITTRPCIITYTHDRIPHIADHGDGRYVITAGNGGGAKGADAWGAQVADLITG